MNAQALPALNIAVVASVSLVQTTLVPIATQQNSGWTATSGTVHAALAAIGGARITTSNSGASALVTLG